MEAYPTTAAGGGIQLIPLPTTFAGYLAPRCAMAASPHSEPGVWYDMTVAMGVLSESVDCFASIDSRVANESAMTMTDGVLKSVRINGLCALPFCGDAAYANHVVATLFRLGEEAGKEPEGILQLVEDEPMTLETDPYGIAHYVRGIFSHYDNEVRKGNIAMPRLCHVSCVD